MDFDFVIVAVEGFQTENGGLILRELTIIFSDGSEQHFQFKNPDNFLLNESEMKTAKFCQKHLNGFSPTNDEHCCLPYAVYPKILERIRNCRIYCAGDQTRRFFTVNLPNAHVVDACSVFDFHYPKELENPRCFKLHRYRFCALAKARYLAQTLEGFDL